MKKWKIMVTVLVTFFLLFLPVPMRVKKHFARGSNRGPAQSQLNDQHTRPLGQPPNHVRWQIIGPYMY